MSRCFAVLLAGILFSRPLYAAPTAEEISSAATPVESGRSGHVTQRAAVFVNESAVKFDTNLWMNKGRLFVPLRAISEAAGAIVRYDNNTKTISIQRGPKIVYFKPSYSSARVLVPLRFLSENLGAQIEVSNSVVSNSNILVVNVNWTAENFAPPQVINTKPATPPVPSTVSNTEIAAAIQHNLNQLNAYRAKAGAQALQLDPKISDFARQGSVELQQNHQPHGHFRRADVFNSGFAGSAAENQGDPNGWPIRGGLNATIDAILQAMMDEGPGGGHHDNMLNPKFRRVGIGLVLDGDKLYLTNDFSE